MCVCVLLWLSSIVQLAGHWMPYARARLGPLLAGPVVHTWNNNSQPGVDRVSTGPRRGPCAATYSSRAAKMRASANLLSIKCIQQGNSGWHYQLDNERDGCDGARFLKGENPVAERHWGFFVRGRKLLSRNRASSVPICLWFKQ